MLKFFCALLALLGKLCEASIADCSETASVVDIEKCINFVFANCSSYGKSLNVLFSNPAFTKHSSASTVSSSLETLLPVIHNGGVKRSKDISDCLRFVTRFILEHGYDDGAYLTSLRDLVYVKLYEVSKLGHSAEENGYAPLWLTLTYLKPYNVSEIPNHPVILIPNYYNGYLQIPSSCVAEPPVGHVPRGNNPPERLESVISPDFINSVLAPKFQESPMSHEAAFYGLSTLFEFLVAENIDPSIPTLATLFGKAAVLSSVVKNLGINYETAKLLSSGLEKFNRILFVLRCNILFYAEKTGTNYEIILVDPSSPNHIYGERKYDEDRKKFLHSPVFKLQFGEEKLKKHPDFFLHLLKHQDSLESVYQKVFETLQVPLTPVEDIKISGMAFKHVGIFPLISLFLQTQFSPQAKDKIHSIKNHFMKFLMLKNAANLSLQMIPPYLNALKSNAISILRSSKSQLYVPSDDKTSKYSILKLTPADVTSYYDYWKKLNSRLSEEDKRIKEWNFDGSLVKDSSEVYLIPFDPISLNNSVNRLPTEWLGIVTFTGSLPIFKFLNEIRTFVTDQVLDLAIRVKIPRIEDYDHGFYSSLSIDFGNYGNYFDKANYYTSLKIIENHISASHQVLIRMITLNHQIAVLKLLAVQLECVCTYENMHLIADQHRICGSEYGIPFPFVESLKKNVFLAPFDPVLSEELSKLEEYFSLFNKPKKLFDFLNHPEYVSKENSDLYVDLSYMNSKFLEPIKQFIVTLQFFSDKVIKTSLWYSDLMKTHMAFAILLNDDSSLFKEICTIDSHLSSFYLIRQSLFNFYFDYKSSRKFYDIDIKFNKNLMVESVKLKKQFGSFRIEFNHGEGSRIHKDFAAKYYERSDLEFFKEKSDPFYISDDDMENYSVVNSPNEASLAFRMMWINIDLSIFVVLRFLEENVLDFSPNSKQLSILDTIELFLYRHKALEEVAAYSPRILVEILVALNKQMTKYDVAAKKKFFDPLKSGESKKSNSEIYLSLCLVKFRFLDYQERISRKLNFEADAISNVVTERSQLRQLLINKENQKTDFFYRQPSTKRKVFACLFLSYMGMDGSISDADKKNVVFYRIAIGYYSGQLEAFKDFPFHIDDQISLLSNKVINLIGVNNALSVNQWFDFIKIVNVLNGDRDNLGAVNVSNISVSLPEVSFKSVDTFVVNLKSGESFRNDAKIENDLPKLLSHKTFCSFFDSLRNSIEYLKLIDHTQGLFSFKVDSTEFLFNYRNALLTMKRVYSSTSYIFKEKHFDNIYLGVPHIAFLHSGRGFLFIYKLSDFALDSSLPDVIFDTSNNLYAFVDKEFSKLDIFNVKASFKWLKLTDFSPLNKEKLFHQLKNYEDVDKINLFRSHPSANVFVIHLYRYNQFFSNSGFNDKFIFKSSPNYYIDSDQTLKKFSSLISHDFLILRDDAIDGKYRRKALIPRLKCSVSLVDIESIDIDESGNDLAPKNRLHIIFLAYYTFEKRDFDKCLFYMNQIHQITQFDSQEYTLLLSINKTVATHPAKIALVIRAGWILRRNSKFFPSSPVSDKDLFELPLSRYYGIAKYVSKKFRIHSSKRANPLRREGLLSRTEERDLVKSLLKSTKKRLRQRAVQLGLINAYHGPNRMEIKMEKLRGNYSSSLYYPRIDDFLEVNLGEIDSILIQERYISEYEFPKCYKFIAFANPDEPFHKKMLQRFQRLFESENFSSLTSRFLWLLADAVLKGEDKSTLIANQKSCSALYAAYNVPNSPESIHKKYTEECTNGELKRLDTLLMQKLAARFANEDKKFFHSRADMVLRDNIPDIESVPDQSITYSFNVAYLTSPGPENQEGEEIYFGKLFNSFFEEQAPPALPTFDLLDLPKYLKSKKFAVSKHKFLAEEITKGIARNKKEASFKIKDGKTQAELVNAVSQRITFIEGLIADITDTTIYDFLTDADFKIFVKLGEVSGKHDVLNLGKDLTQWVAMFLKSSFRRYKFSFPMADLDVITNMHNLIGRFIFLKTQLQHLGRILNLLKSPLSVESTNLVALEVKKKRAYDPAVDRVSLAFELFANFRLRSDQVNDIRIMTTKNDHGKFPSIVIQRLMSAGKTKVLGVFLAFLKSIANEGVSVMIPPSSLYLGSSSDLQSTSLKYFNQKAFSFAFSRDPIYFKPEFLDDIFQELELVEVNEDYVIVSPEMVQTMQNKLIEGLVMLNEITDPNIKQTIKDQLFKLGKVLHYFRSRGNATLDEVDLTFNPSKELNFPLKQVPDQEAEFRELFVKVLLRFGREEYLLNGFPDGFKIEVLDNLQADVSKKRYEEKILPLLIEFIDGELQRNTGFSADMTKITNGETWKGDLKKFLSLPESDPFNVKKWIGDLHKSCSSNSAVAARLEWLVVLRLQLHSWLPSIFTQKVLLEYGPSNDPETDTAKPYISTNTPNEKSEFAFKLEVMTKTVLTLLYKGLSTNQVSRLIQTLQALMADTVTDDEDLKIVNDLLVEVNKVDNSVPSALIAFDTSKTKHIKVVHSYLQSLKTKADDHYQYKLIRKLMDVIEVFCKHVAFQKIMSSEFQISSNAQNIASAFGTFQAYSGTLENLDILPLFVNLPSETHQIKTELRNLFFGAVDPDRNEQWVGNVQLDRGQNGRVIHHLARKHSPNVDVVPKEELSIENLFTQLGVSKTSDKVRSFLDIGSYFKHLPNTEVAKAILSYFQKASNVNGVLFYKGDQLFCLKSGENHAILIPGTHPDIIQSTTGLSKNQVFIFFDQAHTTGVDIAQIDDAEAIASFGSGISIRDLLQGIMRMRKFLLGQKVKFFVTASFFKYFKDLTSLVGPGFTIQMLILAAEISSIQAEERESILAISHKISNIFRMSFFEKLFQSIQPINDEKLTKLNEFFVKNKTRYFLRKSEETFLESFYEVKQSNLVSKAVDIKLSSLSSGISKNQGSWSKEVAVLKKWISISDVGKEIAVFGKNASTVVEQMQQKMQDKLEDSFDAIEPVMYAKGLSIPHPFKLTFERPISYESFINDFWLKSAKTSSKPASCIFHVKSFLKQLLKKSVFGAEYEKGTQHSFTFTSTRKLENNDIDRMWSNDLFATLDFLQTRYNFMDEVDLITIRMKRPVFVLIMIRDDVAEKLLFISMSEAKYFLKHLMTFDAEFQDAYLFDIFGHQIAPRTLESTFSTLRKESVNKLLFEAVWILGNPEILETKQYEKLFLDFLFQDKNQALFFHLINRRPMIKNMYEKSKSYRLVEAIINQFPQLDEAVSKANSYTISDILSSIADIKSNIRKALRQKLNNPADVSVTTAVDIIKYIPASRARRREFFQACQDRDTSVIEEFQEKKVVPTNLAMDDSDFEQYLLHCREVMRLNDKDREHCKSLTAVCIDESKPPVLDHDNSFKCLNLVPVKELVEITNVQILQYIFENGRSRFHFFEVLENKKHLVDWGKLSPQAIKENSAVFAKWDLANINVENLVTENSASNLPQNTCQKLTNALLENKQIVKNLQSQCVTMIPKETIEKVKVSFFSPEVIKSFPAQFKVDKSIMKELNYHQIISFKDENISSEFCKEALLIMTKNDSSELTPKQKYAIYLQCFGKCVNEENCTSLSTAEFAHLPAQWAVNTSLGSGIISDYQVPDRFSQLSREDASLLNPSIFQTIEEDDFKKILTIVDGLNGLTYEQLAAVPKSHLLLVLDSQIRNSSANVKNSLYAVINHPFYSKHSIYKRQLVSSKFLLKHEFDDPGFIDFAFADLSSQLNIKGLDLKLFVSKVRTLIDFVFSSASPQHQFYPFYKAMFYLDCLFDYQKNADALIKHLLNYLCISESILLPFGKGLLEVKLKASNIFTLQFYFSGKIIQIVDAVDRHVFMESDFPKFIGKTISGLEENDLQLIAGMIHDPEWNNVSSVSTSFIKSILTFASFKLEKNSFTFFLSEFSRSLGLVDGFKILSKLLVELNGQVVVSEAKFVLEPPKTDYISEKINLKALTEPAKHENSEYFLNYLKAHPNFKRTVALFLGDASIKEMKDQGRLEGGHLSYTAPIIRALFELAVFRNHLTSNVEVQNLRKKLNCLAALSNGLRQENEYLEMVSMMSISDSLVFPFGWSSNQLGHAMLLELKKLENDQFQFLVYNSGAGLTFHFRRRFQDKVKYYPMLCTEPFDEKILAESHFFEAFIALLCPPKDSDEYSERDAYGILKARFKFIYDKEGLDLDKFIITQFAGTCSVGAILSLMKIDLSKSLNDQILHQMGVTALEILSTLELSELWLELGIRFAQSLIRDYHENSSFEALREMIKDFELRINKIRPISLDYTREVASIPVEDLIIPSFVTSKSSLISSENHKPVNEEIISLPQVRSIKTVDDIVLYKEFLTQVVDKDEISLDFILSPLVSFSWTDIDNRNPTKWLHELKEVIFKLFNRIAKAKEISTLVVVAVAKVFALSWKFATEIDEEVFKDRSDCKMTTYGVYNFLDGSIFSYKRQEFFASPFLLNELNAAFDRVKNSNGGLFLEPFNDNAFLPSNSKTFKYLNSLKKTINVDDLKSKAEVLKATTLGSATLENILVSLLFVADDYLPSQFVQFRNIYFMCKMMLLSKDSVYKTKIISLVNHFNGNLKFRLSPEVANWDNQFFARVIPSMFHLKLEEINNLAPISVNSNEKAILEKALEDSSSMLNEVCVSGTISRPAVVSLFTNAEVLISRFSDHLLMHMSLFSLSNWSSLRQVSPNYWQHVLKALDSLANHSALYTDLTCNEYYESGDLQSSFQQFLFWALEKIFYLEQSRGSGAQIDVLLHNIRQSLIKQLSNLSDFEIMPRYHSLALIILSYENETASENSIVEIISAQLIRKSLGVDKRLPFDLDSLATATYTRNIHAVDFKNMASLSSILSKVFNCSSVASERSIFPYILGNCKEDFLLINLLTEKVLRNHLPITIPQHIFSNSKVKKLLGYESHKPKFTVELGRQLGSLIYAFPQDAATYYVYENSEGNIQIEKKDLKSGKIFKYLEAAELFNSPSRSCHGVLWYDYGGHQVLCLENEQGQKLVYSLDVESLMFQFPSESSLWQIYSLTDVAQFPLMFDAKVTILKSSDKTKIVYDRVFDETGIALSFETDISGHVKWISNPEYLVKNIESIFPSAFRSYIPVSDFSGEKIRILLPVKARNQLLNLKEIDVTYTYMTISINDDRKLIASNPSQYFYLAYLFMVYHDFQSAWNSLQHISHATPFSDVDLKFAAWVFTYGDASGEHFPEIYAISAFTHWLVFENSMNFGRHFEPPASTAHHNQHPNIESHYADDASFSRFWKNEVSIRFSSNGSPIGRCRNLAQSVISHYYDIHDFLPFNMIFHDFGKFVSVPRSMELIWLKSLSINSLARIDFINGARENTELSKFHTSDPAVKIESVLPLLKEKGFNEVECSLLEFFKISPHNILRPSESFIFKHFRAFYFNALLAESSERDYLIFYLKDAMNEATGRQKNLLAFLHFILQNKNTGILKDALSLLDALIVSNEPQDLSEITMIFNSKASERKVANEFTPLDPTVLENIDLSKFLKFSEFSKKSHLPNNAVLQSAEIPLSLDYSSPELFKFAFAWKASIQKLGDFSQDPSLEWTNNLSTVIGGLKKVMENSLYEIKLKMQNLIRNGRKKVIERMELSNQWKMPDPANLIFAFCRSSKSNYRVLIPFLNDVEIEKVHQFMLEYVSIAVVYKSSLKALFMIKTVEGLIKSKSSETMVPVESLRKLLQSEREYLECSGDVCKVRSIDDPHVAFILPTIISFEFNSGLPIRPGQFRDIYLLSKKENKNKVVLQRMMSSGKTYFFGPLMALVNSDGYNLSIVIAPKALVSINAADLIARTRNFFGVNGRFLVFQRSKKFTNIEMIRWLLLMIKESIMRREFIITTLEDLQAIRNCFLEELKNNVDFDDLNRHEIIEGLREAMFLFKSKGRAIIDEIDWTLNPLSVLNFPISAEVRIDKDIAHMIGAFFTTVCKDEELSKELSLTNSVALSVQNEKYLNLRPKLLKIATDVLKTYDDSNNVLELISCLDKDSLQIMEENGFPEKLKEAILIMNAIVNDHIPDALGKKVNEHYGLSKKYFEKFKHAKPYASANTVNELSDFADLLVLVTKTLRTYLQVKIRNVQIRQMVEDLRKEALVEKQKKFIGISETEVVLKFDECFKFKSLFKINLSVDSDLNSLRKGLDNFCGLEYMIKYLVQNVIMNLGQFPQEISSTASNAISMLQWSCGYSGTIDNEKIFDEQVKVYDDKSIYSKIKAKMLINNKIYTFQGMGLSISQVLRQLQENLKDFHLVQAVIDGGAYFRHFSNFEVAKSILAMTLNFKGILFFDEASDDLFCLKEREVLLKMPGSDILTILSTTGLGLKDLFLFLDQRHCTGTDIKLSTNAIGLYTVSETSLIRDVYQGVMRMRNLLDSQQQVVLISPQELLPQFTGKSSVVFDVELFLAHAEANSKKRKQIEDSSVYIQKLENSIQDKVVQLLIHPNADLKYLRNVFAAFGDILIIKKHSGQIERVRGLVRPVYDFAYISSTSYQDKLNLFFNESEIKQFLEFAQSLNKPQIIELNLGDATHVQQIEIQEELKHEQKQEHEQQEIVTRPSFLNDKFVSLEIPPQQNLRNDFLGSVSKFQDILGHNVTSSRFWLENVDHPFRIWNLKKILKRIGGFDYLARIFDDRIHTTINFSRSLLKSLTLFDFKMRWFPKEILLLKHKDNSIPFRIILLSYSDIESILVFKDSFLVDYDHWLLDLELNVTFPTDKPLSVPLVELVPIVAQIAVLSGSPFILSRQKIYNSAYLWFKSNYYEASLMTELTSKDNVWHDFKNSFFYENLSKEFPSSSLSLEERNKLEIVRGICLLHKGNLSEAKDLLASGRNTMDSCFEKSVRATAALLTSGYSIAPKWTETFVKQSFVAILNHNRRQDFIEVLISYVRKYGLTVLSDAFEDQLIVFIQSAIDKEPDLALKFMVTVAEFMDLALATNDHTYTQFSTIILRLCGFSSKITSLNLHSILRETDQFSQVNVPQNVQVLLSSLSESRIRLKYLNSFLGTNLFKELHTKNSKNPVMQNFFLQMTRNIYNVLKSNHSFDSEHREIKDKWFEK